MVAEQVVAEPLSAFMLCLDCLTVLFILFPCSDFCRWSMIISVAVGLGFAQIRGGQRYLLRSTVNHQGTSLHAGHCIAVARPNPQDVSRWAYDYPLFSPHHPSKSQDEVDVAAAI